MLSKGFSLVEVLMGLSLLAVAGAWAIPTASDALNLVRLRTAVQSYIQAVHFARSNALNSGTAVRLCPSKNGHTCSHSPYHQGWIVLREAITSSATSAVDAQVLQDQSPWKNLKIISNQSSNLGLLFLPNGTPEPRFFGMTLRFQAGAQTQCVVMARTARIRYAQC